MVPVGFNFREVLKKEQVEHIRYSDGASAVVIAPATANIIGKIANGIADDLLTTIVMATTAPVIICPSMNIHMWKNPIVAENVKKLINNGYIVVPPEKGRLACGYEGVGRLADINSIYETAISIINKRNRLKGKRILVTAGGTSEAIDAVRVITNKGSGKMGVAIAQECAREGAQVLLLKAKNAVSSQSGINVEEFETGEDLEKLMEKKVRYFDYVFHTAAVSDFKPESPLNKKIDSASDLTLKFKTTAKIIDNIKEWNPEIKLIGFKAVYKLTEKELIEAGMEKLEKSRADFIVVNDIGKEGIGFGEEDNEVYLLSTLESIVHLKKTTKKMIARQIVNLTIK